MHGVILQSAETAFYLLHFFTFCHVTNRFVSFIGTVLKGNRKLGMCVWKEETNACKKIVVGLGH